MKETKKQEKWYGASLSRRRPSPRPCRFRDLLGQKLHSPLTTGALALRFRQDLLDAAAGGSPGEGGDAAMERAKQTGDAVFTTTALIVLATVLVVGGSTNALIEHLQLKEPSMPPSERDELLLAEGGGDALDSNGGALGRGANGGTDDADEHGIEMAQELDSTAEGPLGL